MTYPSFISTKKDRSSKFLIQTVGYAHAKYLKESVHAEKEHTVYSWFMKHMPKC